MSCALDAPPPAAPPARGAWIDLLTRIAEEVAIDGTVRVAGELLAVPAGRRLVTAALAEAVHVRYVVSAAGPVGALRTVSGRGGAEACARLATGLRPQFLGRDGWTFTYRREGRAPVFVVTSGAGPGPGAAGCYLDLTPGIAPEAFARLVTTLDGYGLDFRAQLRGHSPAPDRVGTAIVTVARQHAPAVARAALRMRDRSPLLFGRSVAAFTRALAPGIGLADEPPDGTGLGRHRAGLIAAALVGAGPVAGPAERLTAVLDGLAGAGLDVDALHLNPGSPEFRI